MFLVFTMCQELSECAVETSELIKTRNISEREALRFPHFIDEETKEEIK